MQIATEYRKSEVNTADNIRIISLLYDGAINFIRIARKRAEQRDIAGKGLYVVKATAIVGELSSSLNMEENNEISKNLRRLYDFVIDRLFNANLRNNMSAFDEAEKVLDILRGAWKEMEKSLSASKAAAKSPDNNTSLGLRI